MILDHETVELIFRRFVGTQIADLCRSHEILRDMLEDQHINPRLSHGQSVGNQTENGRNTDDGTNKNG